MRSVVSILLVILACVNGGEALKCVQCSSYSDSGCTADPTDCPSSSDACATTLMRNRGERWTSYYLIRSCASKADCSNSGRVSGLYTETSYSTSCCFSDNCSPSLPTMPAVSLTLNGLLCPAYVDKTMEPCDIKNVSTCTGEQNRCIRYSQTTQLGSTKNTLYYGGCATLSDCATEKSYVSGGDITIEMKKTCYNGAGALHARSTAALALPIILLLLRALLGSGGISL